MYRDFQRADSDTRMHTEAPRLQPDESAALILLQYMSSTELNEYANDNDKLDSLIKDLHQVKTIQKDKENVIVKNRSLAEYNLSLQPRFEELKREVATAYETVNSLKMPLAQDVAKLESLAGRQSQEALVAVSQTEAATADESSEDIADSFCDGNTDIDTFVKDYLEKRTDAYIKKAKAEKLAELVRQQGSVPSQYQPNPVLPKPVYGSGSPGLPYPPNNYNTPAPMPGAYGYQR